MAKTLDDRYFFRDADGLWLEMPAKIGVGLSPGCDEQAVARVEYPAVSVGADGAAYFNFNNIVIPKLKTGEGFDPNNIPDSWEPL